MQDFSQHLFDDDDFVITSPDPTNPAVSQGKLMIAFVSKTIITLHLNVM